ncbi:MAG: alpha-ketoacid dehydrogenase subunit beta [Myxococcota bacterium]
MPTMNVIEAVNSALTVAMSADERVLVLGEDVGKFGGVFRATKGLYETFGPDRSIDTPLAEGGIIGCAIGMALNGLRPVAEIQFSDFIYPGFDQIVSELAKFRYRSGGQYAVPLVIRTPVGGGIGGGHYHSQSPEAYFIHTAGLKVICPATPYDAKGLLLTAIRDEDPVMFLEPKRVYRAAKGDVPRGDYTIPFGEARIVRRGKAMTIVAWGAMVHEAKSACEAAEAEGIDCELLDLRSLLPLDIDSIVQSVQKTGRFIVVHEAPRTCGFGAELVALISEKCFYHLEARPTRVTGFDTPFPYTLENEYLPLAPRILRAIQAVARDSA